jgi:hypothetical protein
MNPDDELGPDIDRLERLRKALGMPEMPSVAFTAPPNSVLTAEELEKAIREMKSRRDREAMQHLAERSALSFSEASKNIASLTESMSHASFPSWGSMIGVDPSGTGIADEIGSGEWNPADGVGELELERAYERILIEVRAGWIVGPEDVIKVGRELLTRLTNDISAEIRRAQDAGE